MTFKSNNFFYYNLIFITDICYILLIIYLSTNLYFNPTSKVHIFTYLLCSAYSYLLTKEFITNIPLTRTIIQISLIILGISEAIYGCLQLYGLAIPNNSLYKITGSFLNPGPYAGFLISILPLALGQALTFKSTNKYIQQTFVYISWLYIFLCLTLLPATMSRAAWLAASIGTGIVLISHYKIIPRTKQYLLLHRKQAIIYSVAACLVFGAIGAGIYHLKKDSADGRLLMWKVTSHIIAEHPLTGVGWGNFAGAYGQAQAEYFAEGNATSQEEYVAGSPDYAFNEFLQITAENGMLGLILFLLVIILAFRSAYKNKQTDIIGSLAAFLTFACFSYPFSVWQMNILFIILIAMAGTNLRNEKSDEARAEGKSTFTMPNKRILENAKQTQKRKVKSKKWEIIALGIALIILTVPIIWQGKKWIEKKEGVTQWKEEQTYYNMEIYEQTVDNYRKLYWQLRDEPKFLFELGQCLAKTEFYEESNRILREGANQSSDPMFWNIMGKNYQAMHHYHEAEACFMHAYNMVPNRLYPLYLLANLYYASGQNEKAIDMAKRVINKEPKVMSTAISEMKAEMKEKLTE